MNLEIQYLILSFLIFAIVHSLMAAHYFKKIITKWWGLKRYNHYYRLLYSIVSVMTLIPVIYFLFADTSLVWSAPAWLEFFLYFIKGVAIVGLLYSIWQIDGLHFLGIRQLRSKHGKQLSQLSDSLVTSGVFGLCRHPLYFFSMLFLWASPDMTLQGLVFTLLTSLYFIIGSYWEESKMTEQFGDAYKQYQRQVPRFIPSLFKKRHLA